MTTKTKEAPANRAVVNINFSDYVFPIEDAITLMRLMEKAERYEKKYRPEEQGGEQVFVWSGAPDLRMSLIGGDEYLRGRIAGHPDSE